MWKGFVRTFFFCLGLKAYFYRKEFKRTKKKNCKVEVIFISVVVRRIWSEGKELVYRKSLVSVLLAWSQEKVSEEGVNNDVQ